MNVNPVSGRDDSGEFDTTARWALIERILNSPEFRRAIRLRELLEYIGRQSIQKGVNMIPEQEIGQAVFGRSADYDTSLDNIVRVNVTELRKRLSLYFEGEGAGEKLLLEIPRGSYIPVFSHRPASAPDRPIAESSETPEAALDNTAERPHQPYRRAFFTVLGVAVVACCAVAFLYWRNTDLQNQLYPWQADGVQRDFWFEFFGSQNEVDLITADSSLALASDFLRRPVSLNDYLDYKYKNIVDAPDLTPDTRDVLTTVLNRGLGSVGDFRVAAEIMALNGHAANLKFSSARAFNPESAKNNNVILIGGPGSNPWYELYKDRLDFYVAYDSARRYPSLINRAPAAGENPVYEIYGDPNLGFSVVAFIPNLSPHRSALIIAGTDSQATLAAGDWITSSEGLRWIRQKAPSGPFPYFEVLLSNSKLESTPMRTEIKTYRIHPR